MRTRQSSLALLAVLSLLTAGIFAQDLTLPNKSGTLKFAVIGDSGTGDSNQYRLAKVLTDIRQKFPYEFVIMVGDNMYGSQSTQDYVKKFETPYKPVLDQGIKFYAALGNHDQPNQAMYKLFNMGGKRFYTFRPRAGVRFFALDSNYMDKEQLDWLQKELEASGSDWKIPFFHHPLYSHGMTHGSDTDLRARIEPIFMKSGVNVVLSGHDHVYERLKPQNGVAYFVLGNAGELRYHDLKPSPDTAKGFDTDRSFMLVEIAGDNCHFQAISRLGATIDSGTIVRQQKAAAAVSN